MEANVFTMNANFVERFRSLRQANDKIQKLLPKAPEADINFNQVAASEDMSILRRKSDLYWPAENITSTVPGPPCSVIFRKSALNAMKHIYASSDTIWKNDVNSDNAVTVNGLKNSIPASVGVRQDKPKVAANPKKRISSFTRSRQNQQEVKSSNSAEVDASRVPQSLLTVSHGEPNVIPDAAKTQNKTPPFPTSSLSNLHNLDINVSPIKQISPARPKTKKKAVQKRQEVSSRPKRTCREQLSSTTSRGSLENCGFGSISESPTFLPASPVYCGDLPAGLSSLIDDECAMDNPLVNPEPPTCNLSSGESEPLLVTLEKATEEPTNRPHPVIMPKCDSFLIDGGNTSTRRLRSKLLALYERVKMLKRRHDYDVFKENRTNTRLRGSDHLAEQVDTIIVNKPKALHNSEGLPNVMKATNHAEDRMPTSISPDSRMNTPWLERVPNEHLQPPGTSPKEEGMLILDVCSVSSSAPQNVSSDFFSADGSLVESSSDSESADSVHTSAPTVVVVPQLTPNDMSHPRPRTFASSSMAINNTRNSPVHPSIIRLPTVRRKIMMRMTVPPSVTPVGSVRHFRCGHCGLVGEDRQTMISHISICVRRTTGKLTTM